jgi:hypothetical protein
LQSQLASEAYTCASQETQDPDEQQQQHVEAEQQHFEAKQQQLHVASPAEKKTRKRGRSAAARPKRKPRRSTPAGENRARRTTTPVSHRPDCIDLLEPSPRVLLRRVFFLNTTKSKYLSVRYYTVRVYEKMVEFGAANLLSVILNEQRLTLLSEHLPELCEALCRSEPYTFRDGIFRLMYGVETKLLPDCVWIRDSSFIGWRN